MTSPRAKFVDAMVFNGLVACFFGFGPERDDAARMVRDAMRETDPGSMDALHVAGRALCRGRAAEDPLERAREESIARQALCGVAQKRMRSLLDILAQPGRAG